ncbi:MAG: MFS transporter [Pseudoruegeria sp.]
MRLMISFAALLMSVFLLQLSTGGVGPLDALSGLALGFTPTEVGFLGSAHFVGFLIGCWWAPRLLGNVGHARAFSAFAATGAIGLLCHMMITTPLAWSIMRIGSGMCVAGCYTIIESWLNAKVTNENRGRAMGTYRIVDMGGSLVAQTLIAFLEPAHFISYNLLAILCCACLIPLTLTTAKQPEVPAAPRLRPFMAWHKSPLSAAGVIVAGLTSAAFRMVGPIYGQEVGLRADQIGLFLAAFVAGGALAQYPAGWLADKYDRRWVLIWLSIAAMFSCATTAFAGSGGTYAVMAGAVVFGLTTFPIFSVSASHAHDFADSHERVELSAALMFLFAIGAIASPMISSALIGKFGPASLFVFIACAHMVLVIFGLSRMLVRPTSTTRTPYVYSPRTSFTIGRLLGSERDKR